MKSKSIVLSLVVLLFSVQSAAVMAQQVDDPHFVAACDEMLAGQFHADEPGATVLIARKGQIVYEKAFGMANLELQVPMQINNVLRIGSITKQFTAVAILQLMEQGKLSLQDEITKFIPDYPTQGSRITIEHLLTHTSGIQDYARIRDTTQRGVIDFTPGQMIDYFKNQPMRFAPGTKWEYSNSNYVLLGYIIERLTGETYQEYLESHIFKPTGMNHSSYASDTRIIKDRADGYRKGDHGFENAQYLSMTQPYAAGAIQSTVEDLFTWHQAVHSYKLLSRASVNKALTRYVLSNGDMTNYGYGWRLGYIQDSPSIWHGGMVNGYIAMAMYLPNEDVFVAVLSNCECNSPEDITAKLAALAIGEPYDYKAIVLGDSILTGYTGVYENAKGLQRVITVSEHQLYAGSGRGPKAKVNAMALDKFAPDQDELSRMEFARGDSGEVEKLVTKSRNGIEVWNKTNKPIPSADGIELSEQIIEAYVGEYEIAPDFSFTVTKDRKRLFVKATGQEAFEIFAESESKFFLKVNDAQLDFVRDDLGNVTKAILTQGGRTTDAKKIK
jgi:CubicO group peptidase (beta-lactamase class C family)